MLLERRLSKDDTLGMGEGVRDNVPTRSVFRLLLESFAVRRSSFSAHVFFVVYSCPLLLCRLCLGTLRGTFEQDVETLEPSATANSSNSSHALVGAGRSPRKPSAGDDGDGVQMRMRKAKRWPALSLNAHLLSSWQRYPLVALLVSAPSTLWAPTPSPLVAAPFDCDLELFTARTLHPLGRGARFHSERLLNTCRIQYCTKFMYTYII